MATVIKMRAKDMRSVESEGRRGISVKLLTFLEALALPRARCTWIASVLDCLTRQGRKELPAAHRPC